MLAQFVGKWLYVGLQAVAQVDQVARSTSYTALASGILDVPDATADATSYTIPVGSAAKVTALDLANNTTGDLSVRFNGASTDAFRLAPGGSVTIINPVTATAGDVTAIVVITKAGPTTSAGSIEYKVFGDPPP